MAEQNHNDAQSASNESSEYQAPAIEEVVTPSGMEREVAYAGVVAPSQIAN